MCLIAHAEKKSLIKNELMAAAYENNSDGWGIVYALDNRLYVCKRMSNFETFKKVMEVVPDDVPVGIHFRFATHGAKDLTNVHPFPVLSIAEGDAFDLCMMHNGVMSFTSSWKANNNDPRSDTSLYVDHVLKPLLKKNPEMAFDPSFAALVGRDIGNGSKFLLLAGDGRHMIINEAQGHTDKEHPGVWFSNSYSLRPSYRSNKSSNNNNNYNYGQGTYGDYWNKQKDKDSSNVTPAVTVSSYQVEKDLPEEMKTHMVAKFGFGAELISPKQGKTAFGFGWCRNAGVLSHGGQEFAQKHREWTTEKEKNKALVVGNTTETSKPAVVDLVTEKTKKLSTTEFRVMNLPEIFEWCDENPEECASWLIANIGFSGGLLSVKEWVKQNTDQASDYVYNKTHFNKVVPTKDAPTIESFEPELDYSYAM